MTLAAPHASLRARALSLSSLPPGFSPQSHSGAFGAVLREAVAQEEKNAPSPASPSPRSAPEATTTAFLNASSVAGRIPAGLRGKIPGNAAAPRAVSRTAASAPVTSGVSPGPAPKAEAPAVAPSSPGTLASRFESGEKGAGAVGHDERGGTSYGLYQITSRTMKRFLKYLDTHAPEHARRLRAAGSADTGSVSGAMPRAWKKIASEDPERFSALQRAFIEESHYAPAREAIEEKTGIAAGDRSPALREVIFSTAVQHGPAAAARIVARAAGRLSSRGEAATDEALVKEIYAVRARRFGSSSPRVRRAVTRRLEAEKNLALAMLKDGSGAPATTV